jgi:hypothetical protein
MPPGRVALVFCARFQRRPTDVQLSPAVGGPSRKRVSDSDPHPGPPRANAYRFTDDDRAPGASSGTKVRGPADAVGFTRSVRKNRQGSHVGVARRRCRLARNRYGPSTSRCAPETRHPRQEAAEPHISRDGHVTGERKDREMAGRGRRRACRRDDGRTRPGTSNAGEVRHCGCRIPSVEPHDVIGCRSGRSYSLRRSAQQDDGDRDLPATVSKPPAGR